MLLTEESNLTLHFHFKLESYGIFHQLKPFGFSLVTSAFHFMPAYASSPTEMKGWAMNGPALYATKRLRAVDRS